MTYNAPRLLGHNHFMIWRGYGTTLDWRDRSEHDMRRSARGRQQQHLKVRPVPRIDPNYP